MYIADLWTVLCCSCNSLWVGLQLSQHLAEGGVTESFGEDWVVMNLGEQIICHPVYIIIIMYY
jgi:hypothetical protein